MKKFLAVLLILVSIMSVGLFAKPFEFTAAGMIESKKGIPEVMESKGQIGIDDLRLGALMFDGKLTLAGAQITASPHVDGDTLYLDGMISAGLNFEIMVLRLQLGAGVRYTFSTDLQGYDFKFEGSGDIMDAPINLRAEVDGVIGNLKVGAVYALPLGFTANDFEVMKLIAVKDNYLNGTIGVIVGLVI